MGSDNLSFKRKERKYIILEHTFEAIKKELEKHIPLYSFEGEDPNTQIETIYLDTKDFLLFNEYLRRRNFRYKIRMRKYGHNDVFEDTYLVELKVKQNSISIKKRFFLPVKLYKKFITGEDILKEIRVANKGLVGATKTYKLIAKLIEINQFVPVLKTTYERLAFQKKSKKIRLTIDRNIKHEKLLGRKKHTSLDAMVLESKVMGKTPKWHKKMVNKLSLLKQARFSKFATGLNSAYFPNRGKYNFFDDFDDTTNEIPEAILKSFDMLIKPLQLSEDFGTEPELEAEVSNE